jgi:phosphate:Na+ symporter
VSTVSTAASLLGGIGLFLLGMRLMTDGLKLAAGESLKRILAEGTRTPARALVAGGAVTALVQSSSAVTVATIGFVNAGLLDLGRAVVLVFGSNVGTTMTGWIVALLGVQLHVGAFAVPLVGVGALLHLVGRGSRRSALGDAIAGFGLFFLGIEILRGAFEGLGEAADLSTLAVPGIAGVVLFVAIGFALTALTQSSSAALALTLTAAAGDVIPLQAAAAAAIGTNVGTTSTAGLAAIGATSNARRVAAAHVVFNLVAGAVALATLPLMLAAVAAVSDKLGLGATPVTAIALFHTGFNLLGVALIWPWKERLVALLRRQFRSREEEEATPRFLDRNVADTPDLAVAALGEELARSGALTRRMVRAVLAPGPAPATALAAQRDALAALFGAVAEFAARVGGRELPPELAGLPPLALQVARYQAETADRALELAALRGRAIESGELRRALEAEDVELARVLDAAEAEPYEVQAGEAARQGVEAAYAPLRSRLLTAAARGEIPVDRLGDQLDRIRAVRRIAEQVEKAARHLALLRGAEGAGARDPE